ncbi:MAG: hypothetical protein U5M51_00775 [Emticicia sp.]|nr:hypothetical protein [Emticicia sp.]
MKNRQKMFADVNEWLEFRYNQTIQETISESYDKQIKALEANF